MRTFGSKVEAFEFAKRKSQFTGSDYRVIEKGDRFVAGTEGKIMDYCPDTMGWNFRYQY